MILILFNTISLYLVLNVRDTDIELNIIFLITIAVYLSYYILTSEIAKLNFAQKVKLGFFDLPIFTILSLIYFVIIYHFVDIRGYTKTEFFIYNLHGGYLSVEALYISSEIAYKLFKNKILNIKEKENQRNTNIAALIIVLIFITGIILSFI